MNLCFTLVTILCYMRDANMLYIKIFFALKKKSRCTFENVSLRLT